MEQERAEAEVEGARSQSVFNSSLSFLGKDYAPLENSLSAHVASPDAGPNNGEQHRSLFEHTDSHAATCMVCLHHPMSKLRCMNAA